MSSQRGPGRSLRFPVLGLATAVALGAVSARACMLEPGPVHAVAAVIDAETVRLDDGREVRLIGALAPRSRDAEAAPEFWAPELEARRALEGLVAGKPVELAYAGLRVDRHGRVLAHLFTGEPGARVWVQGYMVENGHARAYALPGQATCLGELAELEARGRAAGLGLWRNPAYAVRLAEQTRELSRLRQTFQLVEGRVRAANAVKGQIFLNFGDDWRTDFTARLGPDLKRALLAEGHDPTQLEGRMVRVRGWITWRNGPFIDLDDRRALELLAEPPA